MRYLVRLTELELDRERRMVERRIMAKFPASLDSFDFKAMPSLNKMMILELARCEYIERRKRHRTWHSGTGKTHIALGLGLAACQKGRRFMLWSTSSSSSGTRSACCGLQAVSKIQAADIDELGFVPLSKTGAELLFEVFSQRYSSTLVTSNLPFDEWTEVFGSERLTGALLRPAHTPRSYPGDERRQLPSQPEPKTAETPKNLTTQPMVDPAGPTGTSHAASLRVTQALHEAARVPPMDYQMDNRHAGLNRIKWCIFTPAAFTPALTRQFEPRTEVPDLSYFAPIPQRLAPHIYREEEITALLAAARDLPPSGSLRLATYETLFGLIASAGLRVSEAINLLDADVDLKHRVLTICQSKFAKSRRLPIHPTSAHALPRYRRKRHRYFKPCHPMPPFFTSPQGEELRSRQVHRVFAQLREQLGWVNRGAHHAHP